METLPARGLFLDLDGTLADSMPVLEGVYFRFLEERQSPGSQDEFLALAGLPLTETVVRLKKSHRLPDPVGELLADYYNLMDKVYQSAAQPTPGARALLDAARRGGVAVAVVTSARGEVARGFLEHHGLAGLVDQVLGAEATRRGKPHPDPYQKALELTGLGPAQALAVEDTPLGASAALAAGIPTYVITPAGRHPHVPGAAGHIRRLDELIPLL
ncbi:MAG: HAD-IA family hydrolase [Pseudomonadota bacterium]